MNVLRVVGISALVGACAMRAGAQTTYSIVRFEIENFALYVLDCPNSQLASTSKKLDRALGPAFESAQGIGDIVSVNGTPVKGVAYETIVSGLRASPNPMPGGAIADSARTAIAQWEVEFANPDGTPIGTLQISGFDGGLSPPGAPKEISGSALAITGGMGAFFGVRGYFAVTNDPAAPVRRTSACEDPSVRRINAGGQGRRHGVLYLVPLSAPQVVNTPNGPAVTHSSDFSLVTASKPAAAGEILSLFVTGLGPTQPGVDPGQPFPAAPLQVVNSPVAVVVNGKSADVLAAVGFPGAIDGYQVNFRLPPDTAKGPATIQVSAAWIAGAPLSIVVR